MPKFRILDETDTEIARVDAPSEDVALDDFIGSVTVLEVEEEAEEEEGEETETEAE